MSDRINVLFIQSQPNFGADTAVHAHIMRHLDREAFGVHAACTVGDGTGVPPSLAEFEKIPNLELRRTRFLPSMNPRFVTDKLASARALVGFPLEFAALCRYVMRERIRVIHSTDRPRDAACALTLARLTGAKSVIHVHVKWSRGYGAVARWGLAGADYVFGISRFVTESVVSDGKPAARVFTVLNGIDPECWDPSLDGSALRREFSIGERTPLLVSVSRLFSWKGQRELLRAFALVRKQIGDAKLLIVGEEERYVHGGGYTRELVELARTLGVSSDVVFTGVRRDIPQILAACDLFTMPSFEEPFGLVFLEAMAMKKPVIALDNGGTPEVVEHGRSGLLSAPEDIDALASNILLLLRDPDARAAMGQYGRSRVLDHFNAARLARDAAAAYRVIVRS